MWSLSKVIQGTKNLINAKRDLKSKTPHIIFQFLVVRQNEHQIESAIKLSKNLSVDEIRFKTAQLYDYKNGNPLMPTIEKYSRYKKSNNGLDEKQVLQGKYNSYEYSPGLSLPAQEFFGYSMASHNDNKYLLIEEYDSHFLYQTKKKIIVSTQTQAFEKC